MRLPAPNLRLNNRGTAIVEFALALPFMLLLLLGLVDLSVLLDVKMRLTCLSREAANVMSRGASFQETFLAIENADGKLALDGPNGCVILTRISLDAKGNPIITDQQTVGKLNHGSIIGTLPPNAANAPAAIPNGRKLPANMSVVVAEMYSKCEHFYGQSGLIPGGSGIVVGGNASF